MTDLSKAFDCLSHELLIAKFDAFFFFDKMSPKIVHNYLSNRKQRVKINDSYSSWREILGHLLFNIFICHMLYFLGDYEIANYADDTTPYSAQRNHQFVIEELEKSSATFSKWLGNNFMEVNNDKGHLLLSLGI